MKGLAGALLALSVVTSNCPAAPFVPSDPKEVLERLLEAPADSAARELRQLRRELARDPQNVALATRVARRYIERARAEADPRYLGNSRTSTSFTPRPDSPDEIAPGSAGSAGETRSSLAGRGLLW